MYSQKGSYVALAGFVVLILNKLGVNFIGSDTIEATIGAIVTLYGVAHQFYAHRELAKSAGAIPR